MPSTETTKHRKHPLTEEWRTIKPIFLDLYITQGKTLEEVRYELEARHSFIASVKAYKLKVKQWGAFKYRKRQMIHANTGTRQRKFVSGSGKSNHLSFENTFTWEGQPLSPSSSEPLLFSFRLENFTNENIRLGKHLDDHDACSRLFAAAKDFWQWTVRSPSSPRVDHIQSRQLAPGLGLVNIAILLSLPSSYQYGLTKLMEAQEAISSIVHTAPAATFVAMTALFTFHKWRPFPRVQDALFDFIKDCSFRNLPSDHPLRKVFRYATADDMRRVAGKLLVVKIDALTQLQQGGDHVPDWFFLPPTLGLIQSRMLTEANDVTKKRLLKAQTKLEHCRMLVMVLRCRFFNRDYDECIATGLSILQTAKSLLGEEIVVWAEIIPTYDVIAKCYAAKGDRGSTVKYCWLAFKNSVQQFGQDCPGTKFYHNELEHYLNEFRRWEDLTSLRSEYAFMYSSEDNPPKSFQSDGNSPKPGTSLNQTTESLAFV